ncbi:unnamed protein product [Sphagnum tenellum]
MQTFDETQATESGSSPVGTEGAQDTPSHSSNQNGQGTQSLKKSKKQASQTSASPQNPTQDQPQGAATAPSSSREGIDFKPTSLKITLEGEAAKRVLKCEAELRERLSKPDMGKIIGAEILTWSERRWAEMIEENTDLDFFFAQIRKCPDRSKAIKLLKGLSEKLKSENPEEQALNLGLTSSPSGLTLAGTSQLGSETG